jgi:hypothetical protein
MPARYKTHIRDAEFLVRIVDEIYDGVENTFSDQYTSPKRDSQSRTSNHGRSAWAAGCPKELRPVTMIIG